MADYYPLIARAVAALPDNTAEARAAIYDRARNALLGQLRRLEPPIAEEEIDRESAALEVAVARLEGEFSPPAEAPSEPPAADAPPMPEPDAPGERRDAFDEPREAVAQTAPPPACESDADREFVPEPALEPAHREPSPAASPPADDAPARQLPEASAPQDAGALPEAMAPEPFAPERVEAAKSGSPMKGRIAAPLQTRPPMFFKVRRDRSPSEVLQPPARPPRRQPGASLLQTPLAPAAPSDEARLGAPEAPAQEVAPESAGAPAEPAHGAPPSYERRESDAAASLAADATSPTPEAEAERPAAARPRAESQRPFAPQPRREDASRRRLWLFGFIVGLLVFLVAIAAYELRDSPEELRQRAVAPALVAPEPAPNTGKIVDRVGGAEGRAESAQSGSVPTQAPLASSQRAEGGSGPEAGVQTARRAALLLEAPQEPNKVKTYLGAVVWKVENVSAGSGEPLGLAVSARVDIPEEKLEVLMTLQKNVDVSLSASHTMKLEFIQAAGAPLGPVQQISVPQMRREDTPTGESLNGAPVQLAENAFLVGLSSGPAEADNLALLRSREWIDVPILLANGKIAKLTFEKGSAGNRAIDDAIAAWNAP